MKQTCSRGTRIHLVTVIALTLAMAPTSIHAVPCPDILGDLDDSGATDVVDVQCAILTALNLLSDEGFPGCLNAPTDEADLNCDASWDITDVVLTINGALNQWATQLDADGNGCIDSCEEPTCACLSLGCEELCNGADDNCNGLIDEGLGTKPCEASNSNGTCEGTTTCFGSFGWAPCSALPPISEYCNGDDDDCDGEIDEDIAPVSCIKPGPFGVCSGEKVCAGGGWLPCDAPSASPEIFDGEDNNCDGEIDEGFEQTPHKVFALDGIHTEVLSSSDNGDNWFSEADLPAPAPAHVSITGSGSDRLYVLTSGASNPSYRSLDGGESFEPAGIWPNKANNATLCAHPNLNIVYGTDATGNIYRSSFNNGETFTWMGTWPTLGSTLACVVTPSGALYLIDAAYAGGPVHVSTDDGASVTQKTNYGGKSGAMASIASDPGGNLFALDGENNVMLSTDGAETWHQAGTIPAGNQTAQSIAAGGYGVLYAATPNPSNSGTGGRFFVSTDMGWTWAETSNWKGPDGPSGWVALTTLPL